LQIFLLELFPKTCLGLDVFRVVFFSTHVPIFILYLLVSACKPLPLVVPPHTHTHRWRAATATRSRSRARVSSTRLAAASTVSSATAIRTIRCVCARTRCVESVRSGREFLFTREFEELFRVSEIYLDFSKTPVEYTILFSSHFSYLFLSIFWFQSNGIRTISRARQWSRSS
jgi:hypothetical protein